MQQRISVRAEEHRRLPSWPSRMGFNGASIWGWGGGRHGGGRPAARLRALLSGGKGAGAAAGRPAGADGLQRVAGAALCYRAPPV
eukprot:3234432-Rhodomonas_salina.2